MTFRPIGFLLVIFMMTLLSARAQVTSSTVVSSLEERRTISVSKQFRVIADDRATRNSFAAFAERQKTDLLNALDMEDTWHHPIVLQISGKLTDPPSPRPVRLAVTQIEEQGDFVLTIRIRLGMLFSREEMSATLLHALLFEMALRDIEIEATENLIPRWVRVGLPRALELRRKGRQSGLFKTMFKHNLVNSAEEILSSEDDDMDSVGRTVYRASAAGFVLMLLDQKGGAASFGKLIHSYGGAHGKRGHNLLARFYPSLIGTSDRLEQTWILYCAKLSQPQATEFLTPSETEAQLAEAIKVSFLEFAKKEDDEETVAPRKGFLGIFQSKASKEEAAAKAEDTGEPAEEETVPFEGSIADFERFLAREDRAEILAPVQQRLLQLGLRAFPLHRPLIREYDLLLVDLLAGRPAGAADRLAKLKSERESLIDLMRKVKVYMDNYESENTRGPSGVFDNFMEGSKALENRGRANVDPISRYLDEAEEALK